MKTTIFAMSLVIVVSGCAPMAAKQRYDDSLTNLRYSSMRVAESISKEAGAHLAQYGEEKTVEEAKKAVKGSLKDPESARFQSVRIASYLSGSVVCGEVNAKNSYGGYTGFKRFMAGVKNIDFYSYDNKYQSVSDASNSGIIAACGY